MPVELYHYEVYFFHETNSDNSDNNQCIFLQDLNIKRFFNALCTKEGVCISVHKSTVM